MLLTFIIIFLVISCLLGSGGGLSLFITSLLFFIGLNIWIGISGFFTKEEEKEPWEYHGPGDPFIDDE